MPTTDQPTTLEIIGHHRIDAYPWGTILVTDVANPFRNWTVDRFGIVYGAPDLPGDVLEAAQDYAGR